VRHTGTAEYVCCCHCRQTAVTARGGCCHHDRRSLSLCQLVLLGPGHVAVMCCLQWCAQYVSALLCCQCLALVPPMLCFAGVRWRGRSAFKWCSTTRTSSNSHAAFEDEECVYLVQVWYSSSSSSGLGCVDLHLLRGAVAGVQLPTCLLLPHLQCNTKLTGCAADAGVCCWWRFV